MQTVIYLLAIMCFSVLFVVAEPFILLKRYLGFKEEEIISYSAFKAFIYKLINCAMCSGFYIGLIFTQNIYYAGIISIGSELIYKKIMN